MVPIHLKKFSFSGKADTLFSVLIIRAISSFWSLKSLNKNIFFYIERLKLSENYRFETLPDVPLTSSWLLFVADDDKLSGLMFWLLILFNFG